MSTSAHLRVRENDWLGRRCPGQPELAQWLHATADAVSTRPAVCGEWSDPHLTSAAADPIEYVARHLAGDWGDLEPQDCAANDRALRLGERIISAYRLANDEKIWIITEADRSATTIFLPAEY